MSEEDFTFEEVLFQITEANLMLTPQSIDKMYGLFKYLYETGSIQGYEELEPKNIRALLVATFATARNHVIVNEQM